MDVLTLGIDIGGTNFRIGVVDSKGEVHSFEKNSSRVFDNGNVDKVICDEISSYIEKYNYKGKVSAVAIGLPSLISKDKKTVISTPNINGFDNLRLSDVIGERLNVPVYVDRDVNFLLQNDIRKLNLDPNKTILGFYVGTGFGNAIYINGNFYSGKNGAAGELGHIPLIDNEEVCTCGNIGCAEVRCSGKYLEKITAEYFPGTIIRNVFKEHGEDPRIQKYVRQLAIPIATEINILDPDYIVLAGGVLYMENFPKDILVEAIHQMTRKPYPEQNLEIYFSQHNQMSGVYGSGDFAQSMLKKMSE